MMLGMYRYTDSVFLAGGCAIEGQRYRLLENWWFLTYPSRDTCKIITSFHRIVQQHSLTCNVTRHLPVTKRYRYMLTLLAIATYVIRSHHRVILVSIDRSRSGFAPN